MPPKPPSDPVTRPHPAVYAGVPVETVVELLMHHGNSYVKLNPRDIFPVWIDVTSELRIEAATIEELRAKVREYVETLRKNGE
jgi:hypothetical protein